MKIKANKKGSLSPMPKILVTVRDNEGNDNGLIVGYCCNCSFDPPMLMVGIVPSRYSHHMIKENGCFVAHILTKDQSSLFSCFGRKSGKDLNKFKEVGAVLKDAEIVNAGIIEGCPVAVECTVVDSIMTGSHEMFVGKVEVVHAEEEYVNEDGDIDFSKIDLI